MGFSYKKENWVAFSWMFLLGGFGPFFFVHFGEEKPWILLIKVIYKRRTCQGYEE